MSWIEKVAEAQATGSLKLQYDQALKRSGKIFEIVRIQSLNPDALRASMALYVALMHRPSPLSRATREMLGVVVSAANRCHYWVEAHADDLRAEVDDQALVTAIKTDYRTAKLDEATRALLDYAVKLTRTPAEMAEDDVVRLRNLGHSDRAILDAAEIIGYFNYINRIADGLHVDLEAEMPPR